MKIFDLKKSEQTDKLKERLWYLTQQFVRKYWRVYYPQFKGGVDELDELVSEYYMSFLTEKSREKGKEESLLDKFDPKITSLEYLVKIAVQRKLIDSSRKDKGEKNYVEKYDEETGDLSTDFLSAKVAEDDPSVDDRTFSEDEIFELRDRWDELDDKQKKHFLRMYREVKGVLAPAYRELFKDLTGE